MLLIDASNVLHVQGVLPQHLAGLGLPGLIRLIGASRHAGRRVTIVCDGGGSARDSGFRMANFQILFAGHGREADDVIEALIERYHRGNPLEVVSSDRRLRRAARRRGAGSIASEDFLAQIVADEALPAPTRINALREQVPLDAYSVQEWIREFGLPPAPAPKPTQQQAPPPLPDTNRPSEPARRPPTAPRHPPALIGEPLRITPLPGNAPDSGPASPPPAPEPPAARRVTAPANNDGAIDPLLLAALEEWRGRLSLDDLDMQRWLPDLPPRPTPP
jgi:hypothetical protein